MREIDYKRLYLDYIDANDTLSNPVKKDLKSIIEGQQNDDLSYRVLMQINTVIRENVNTVRENMVGYKQYNAYDKEFIRYVLSYQKRNNLTNKDISLKFRMSRNTVAKWKRLFKSSE